MKIVYEDKESINIDDTISQTNKIMAEDVNEIKKVVNTNDDILTEALVEIEDIKKLDLGDTMPIGSVVQWFGDIAPENWLILDGQAISRRGYAELFKIYGTKYGEGDGSATFNLPNLKGRVVTGLDDFQEEFNAIGKMGGEKAHTLSMEEMPDHNHSIDFYKGSGSWSYGVIQTAKANGVYEATIPTTYRGSNHAHNNLQPYIVSNYIVKAKTSATYVGTKVIDDLSHDSGTEPLSAKQGKILNEKITKLENDVVYEVTLSTNENAIEVTNIDMCRDGGLYKFELYHSATTNDDVIIMVNDISQGYYNIYTNVFGRETGKAALVSNNNVTGSCTGIFGYTNSSTYPNYPSVMTGQFYFSNNSRKTLAYDLKNSVVYTGYQGYTNLFGNIDKEIDNVTKLKFYKYNGMFLTGTRLVIRKGN